MDELNLVMTKDIISIFINLGTIKDIHFIINFKTTSFGGGHG